MLLGATLGSAFAQARPEPAGAIAELEPPPTAATNPELPFRIEREDREIVLAPTIAEVAIENLHGDVHVRNADARTVHAHAVIQLLGSPPELPIVDHQVALRRLEIKVRYESDRRTGRDALVGGNRKGRVDLTVFVPKGLRVRVSTSFGQVTARGVGGEFFARSGAGSLLVSGENRIELRSDSGVIRAVLLGDRWRNGSGLHSDSGAVTAIIPSTANVRVSARTCGLLQSKIPNIDRVSRGRCSRAAGRLGTGRSRLEISSETGPVVIQAWIPLNR